MTTALTAQKKYESIFKKLHFGIGFDAGERTGYQSTHLHEDLSSLLLQHGLGVRILGQRLHQVVFGQAEEVRVADAADVGGSSVARPAALDVEDADLSEVASVTQHHELRDSVVRHHGQLSFFNDVHLPADVALLADVVSGAVDLRLELQHQLHQKPGLAVREDAHLLQCVQVDVYSDLRPQLVRKVLQHLPLVHRFLVGPQEIKPLDDPFLQVFGDLSEAHVLFDSVDASLEIRSCRVGVSDHGAHITDDGGKNQHADQEVCYYEEVLWVFDRRRCFSDGGERERGPVHAVCVLLTKRPNSGSEGSGYTKASVPKPMALEKE